MNLIEEAKKFQFGASDEVIESPISVCLTPFCKGVKYMPMKKTQRAYPSIPAVHLHGKAEAEEFFQFAAEQRGPVCILSVQKTLHEIDRVSDKS